LGGPSYDSAMSPAPTNILLMGLRASGKTTLGQILAARLGLAFVDLDDVTAARLGCVDVPEAWSRHGPEAFRHAEADALRDVLTHTGQIIALGGGTPTAPGAEAILRNAVAARTIHLIYLRATPGTLRARLMLTDTASRPSLTGGDVIDEVQRVFDARDPLYRSLASDVVQLDATTPEAATAALLDRIKKECPKPN